MTVFMCVAIEKEQAETPRQDRKAARLLTPQPILLLAENAEAAKLEAALTIDLSGVDRKRLEVLARPF